MATKRIGDEPAYVLHHYDWSESSLILEMFTRHAGRVALVAKGVKKPSSSFRPVLLPLQPLRVSYGGDADIRTLKSVDWVGGHVMPTGEALLSGYYLNELLMRLLARDDPHERVFDVYAPTVALLASGQNSLLQPALRAFELLLLRELGLLPTLDAQTLSLHALQPEQTYALVPEVGLRRAATDDRYHLSGAQWLALNEAMSEGQPLTALWTLPELASSALRVMLRQLLTYHCGVGALKTRQIMLDLQNL